jgi:hypothetical protein
MDNTELTGDALVEAIVAETILKVVQTAISEWERVVTRKDNDVHWALTKAKEAIEEFVNRARNTHAAGSFGWAMENLKFGAKLRWSLWDARAYLIWRPCSTREFVLCREEEIENDIMEAPFIFRMEYLKENKWQLYRPKN